MEKKEKICEKVKIVGRMERVKNGKKEWVFEKEEMLRRNNEMMLWKKDKNLLIMKIKIESIRILD
jgi:hypothetical protein